MEIRLLKIPKEQTEQMEIRCHEITEELKVGELILRKIIQFLLTEACVLFVIFFDSSESDRSPWLIGMVALSILVIFILATLSDWLQNYLTAKQMTEDLKNFQGRFQE